MSFLIPDSNRQQFTLNNFSEKYRCCCRSVHVKQGANIIGLLSAISFVVYFMNILFKMISYETDLPIVILPFTFSLGFYYTNFLSKVISFGSEGRMLEICYLVFESMALILLCIGLLKNRKNFLIPFMVSKTVGLILCMLMAMLSMWTSFNYSNFSNSNFVTGLIFEEVRKHSPRGPVYSIDIRMYCTVLSIWSVLSAASTAWWNFVIYRCYIYLRDMESTRSDAVKTVEMSLIDLARTFDILLDIRMDVDEKSNTDNTSIPNPEWLEIKQTGKYDTRYVRVPVKEVNWVYTPSGRFCVCVWDVAKKEEVYQYYINEYLFTFIDLVNKENFEMPLKFEPFIINRLYETYGLRMFLLLRCFRNYKFMEREKFFGNTRRRRIFSNQRNKFVMCDGKDFLLLVSNKEIWGLCECYLIYMIPKDPANKDAPTQEFCCYFENQFRDTDERIKAALGENGEKFSRFLVSTTLHPIIRDTTLWFSLQLSSYSDNLLGHYDVSGTLIGANWTVDLMKLKNIKEEHIDDPGKLLKILEEQAVWHTFEYAAVFHIAEHQLFWHFNPDVGFINVCTYNADYDDKNGTVSHIYPANISGSKPVILETQLIDDAIEGCYTYHPHGALLKVAFIEESIHLRVVKCLKANLKSLALNQALFHENTPIKHHPAYRLCFNGEKYVDYIINEEDY